VSLSLLVFLLLFVFVSRDRSVWAPFSLSTDGGDGFTLLFGVATKLWSICVTSYASRADEGCSPAALRSNTALVSLVVDVVV
jgi:hypothetical protein